MADDGREEVGMEQSREDARDKVTLSGRELIILIIFAPVVFTWLFL